MTIDLGYLLALGDARSCLAALADGAADEVAASHFEHLLIALDTLEPEGPATWSVTADPDALLARLDAAVDRLVERGSEALVLLVIVALAHMRQVELLGPSDVYGHSDVHVFHSRFGRIARSSVVGTNFVRAASRHTSRHGVF